MKRFRPSLRRVISVAVAGFAGAAATLFIATPAFAHHVNTSGSGACDPAGGWNVTWTVTSGGTWKPYYKILTATSNPVGGTISGELGSLATAYKAVNLTFTGTQHFTDAVSSVTLTATALFSTSANADTDTQGGGTEVKTTVNKPSCVADPKVVFKDNCDGTVTVTLDNTSGTAPVTFKLNGDKTVQGGKKLDVTIPAGSGKITVDIPGTPGKDNPALEHTWKQPENCPTATPTPSPTTPVTGASVTGTIGIGAGLLAAGIALIALLFVFRRRRTVAGQ